MDGAEFSGRNDPLTEKIIGVFYEVYNEPWVWVSGICLSRGYVDCASRRGIEN